MQYFQVISQSTYVKAYSTDIFSESLRSKTPGVSGVK